MVFGLPGFVFPDPSEADPHGYLLSGGQLTAQTLERAYKLGIFPWPQVDFEGQVELAWFSPDPRAILPLGEFHLPQRVARRLRRQIYQVRANCCFTEVVRACAEPRSGQVGTWITSEVIAAYTDLHRQGRGHSVEVFRDGRLVGGVYGVAFGSYFSAESMFHRETDTSKIALAYLVKWLAASGFRLLDIQQPSETLTNLGATSVPRATFLAQLQRCLRENVQFVATC